MEMEQAIARLWLALEGQCGDLAEQFMVKFSEVGRSGNGFLVIDRKSGRTVAVEISEVTHNGVTAQQSAKRPSIEFATR